LDLPQIDRNTLNSIREDRNKLAHNKFFYQDDYEKCRKQLNSLNKKLRLAINKIEESEFSEIQLKDVIGAIGEISQQLNGGYQNVFINLSKALNNAFKPIQKFKIDYVASMQPIIEASNKMQKSMQSVIEMKKALQPIIEESNKMQVNMQSFIEIKKVLQPALKEAMEISQRNKKNFQTPLLITAKSSYKINRNRDS
jgi:hypothetical protein